MHSAVDDQPSLKPYSTPCIRHACSVQLQDNFPPCQGADRAHRWHRISQPLSGKRAFVDAGGLVVTNAHVIEESSRL